MDPKTVYDFLVGIYPTLFGNKNHKAIFMFCRLLCSHDYTIYNENEVKSFKCVINDFKDSRNLNLAFRYLTSHFKYECDNNTLYLSLILVRLIMKYSFCNLYFNHILENAMIYFYFVDKLGYDIYSKIVEFTITDVCYKKDYDYLKKIICKYENSSPIEKVILLRLNVSNDMIREKYNKTYNRDMSPIELEYLLSINKKDIQNTYKYIDIFDILYKLKKISHIYGFNLKDYY